MRSDHLSLSLTICIADGELLVVDSEALASGTGTCHHKAISKLRTGARAGPPVRNLPVDGMARFQGELTYVAPCLAEARLMEISIIFEDETSGFMRRRLFQSNLKSNC